MSESVYSAWLLPVGLDFPVALGQHEVKHIETAVSPLTLPAAPPYCRQALLWQEKLLPIFNMAGFIQQQTAEVTPIDRHGSSSDAVIEQLLAVVAFRSGPDQGLSYGGLRITDTPRAATVNASQAVVLAELPAPWRPISHAAFRYQDHCVPVLNLAQLFTRSAAQLTSFYRRQAASA